jgi:hypothetical protein
VAYTCAAARAIASLDVLALTFAAANLVLYVRFGCRAPRGRLSHTRASAAVVPALAQSATRASRGPHRTCANNRWHPFADGVDVDV